MSFQFNDTQAIQAGMALVPNLRDQLMEDALMKLRQQEAGTQQQVVDLKRREAEAAQARMTEYERDLEAALLEGRPAAIKRLQTKYPEITKDAKDAFDAMDEDMRQTTLTEMGGVWERVKGKDYEGAAAKLETRIAADRAAGEDTAEDEEILAMLRSGDPQQQNIASGMIAYSLRAIAGDKFDALTRAIEPEEKTAEERQYEFDLRTYGKAYADAAKITRDSKVVSLQPGGRLDTLGPAPELIGGNQQGGGDPASGAGGVSAPPQRPSLTRDQFKANLDALGPQRAIGLLQRSGIRVVVRSPQEARSLPSGTPLWLPDGSEGWAP